MWRKWKKSSHNQRGSALVIVLIIAIIGIALTLFVVNVSRNVIYSSRMLMDKLQAKLQAESTIEKLKFFVATGRFYPTYVLNASLSGFAPERLYLDGRKVRIGKTTTISLQDAGGKLNVWSPYIDAISALLRMKGIDEKQATIIRDSLLDWYDKNDLRHLNGAETYYYRYESGAKYSPRNFSGVQSIDELSLVRGLNDKKVFNLLRPDLILAYRWLPNLNTLGPLELAAVLNIPSSVAQQLVTLRNVKGSLNLMDVKRIGHITIDPENFRFSPSFTLDVKVATLFNTAREKIDCEICFVYDRGKPYRVLKWVD